MCPSIHCNNFEFHFFKQCWIYMRGGIYGLSIDLLRFIFLNDQGIEKKWIKNTNLYENIDVIHRENGMIWCHQHFLKFMEKLYQNLRNNDTSSLHKIMIF